MKAIFGFKGTLTRSWRIENTIREADVRILVCVDSDKNIRRFPQIIFGNGLGVVPTVDCYHIAEVGNSHFMIDGTSYEVLNILTATEQVRKLTLRTLRQYLRLLAAKKIRSFRADWREKMRITDKWEFIKGLTKWVAENSIAPFSVYRRGVLFLGFNKMLELPNAQVGGLTHLHKPVEYVNFEEVKPKESDININHLPKRVVIAYYEQLHGVKVKTAKWRNHELTNIILR